MEKAMAPHSSSLPGKSHGWRRLVGCSLWGCKESDTTERLPFHFSFSCIGEGNGNPLQCSCLENPRDGGAWWLPSIGSHRVGHDWSDLAAWHLETCYWWTYLQDSSADADIENRLACGFIAELSFHFQKQIVFFFFFKQIVWGSFNQWFPSLAAY